MYTETDRIMDDEKITVVEFLSRFDKFKVDRISMEEAEDNFCCNAKDHFEESRMVNSVGLRFTDDESTVDWERRKLEYTPAFKLLVDFQ